MAANAEAPMSGRGGSGGSGARTNRGASPSTPHKYGLPVETADPALRKRTKAWHWGIPAAQAVQWNDPDFPERMIEIGRIAELHVRDVADGKPRIIEIPKEFWSDFPKGKLAAPVTNAKRRNTSTNETARTKWLPQCHLVFDADHPSQRLYIALQPNVMRAFAPAYRSDASVLLADLAAHVGGRHARRRDYPAVRVTPLGTLEHVVYVTVKAGDENPGEPRSLYDHHMGETDSGISPMLAVDRTGRLWIAGGSYTCPIAGITR